MVQRDTCKFGDFFKGKLQLIRVLRGKIGP